MPLIYPLRRLLPRSSFGGDGDGDVFGLLDEREMQGVMESIDSGDDGSIFSYEPPFNFGDGEVEELDGIFRSVGWELSRGATLSALRTRLPPSVSTANSVLAATLELRPGGLAWSLHYRSGPENGEKPCDIMAKQRYATSSLVIGYALCSSLLAIINKYAVTKFSYPGLLTTLQYLTSAGGVWILGKLGLLSHDPFNWETAKKFAPAALVFYLAIFTNTNLLFHALCWSFKNAC